MTLTFARAVEAFQGGFRNGLRLYFQPLVHISESTMSILAIPRWSEELASLRWEIHRLQSEVAHSVELLSRSEESLRKLLVEVKDQHDHLAKLNEQYRSLADEMRARARTEESEPESKSSRLYILGSKEEKRQEEAYRPGEWAG